VIKQKGRRKAVNNSERIVTSKKQKQLNNTKQAALRKENSKWISPPLPNMQEMPATGMRYPACDTRHAMCGGLCCEAVSGVIPRNGVVGCEETTA
jgi:hypothetical protein